MKKQKQRVHKDLQDLYQEAPIGLCSLDTNLRYLQINDWLAALNGLSVEAHLGRTIRDLLPEVAVGVEQQLRTVIETGEPIIDGRVDAATPAHPGVVRTFLHHYYPSRSEDGSDLTPSNESKWYVRLGPFQRGECVSSALLGQLESATKREARRCFS